MAKPSARFAFLLASSLALGACTHNNTLTPSMQTLKTPVDDSHLVFSEQDSLKSMMPSVTAAMIRLDPRYAEYLKQTRFKFFRMADESTRPDAVAFFDSALVWQRLGTTYTGVNDYPERLASYEDDFRKLISALPDDERPSMTTVKGVLLMLALSNEYAHYRQNRAGIHAIISTASNNGDDALVCSIYTKNQHVSDLMSMDMMGRVLNHAHKTGDRKLAAAVYMVTRKILWSDADIWLNEISEGTPALAETYLEKMALDRLDANTRNAIDFCDIDHGLPWQNYPLPARIQAKTEAPIYYRLPQLSATN